MILHIHQRTGHSVRTICRTLQIPRSSHYHAAQPTPRKIDDASLSQDIKAIFHAHKKRYGYRRIHHQLTHTGHTCCPVRVRRLMKENALTALQPKSYKPQTSDGRADKPSPNILKDELPPGKANQIWTGDITYIPCGGKWLYLAVVMDLYSRKIIGWTLSEHMKSSMVEQAMQKALKARHCPTKHIFHSDRGSQYGSKTFRHILEQANIRQSMSAKANPYHNAAMESFMGTLKAELIQEGHFINIKDAHTEISAYIDGYYNTQRIHSSLNYQTPSQYESSTSIAA